MNFVSHEQMFEHYEKEAEKVAKEGFFADINKSIINTHGWVSCYNTETEAGRSAIKCLEERIAKLVAIRDGAMADIVAQTAHLKDEKKGKLRNGFEARAGNEKG